MVVRELYEAAAEEIGAGRTPFACYKELSLWRFLTRSGDAPRNF